MKTRLIHLINPRADCFTSKTPDPRESPLFAFSRAFADRGRLFPKGKYEVILTDENIEPIDFDLSYDLICISAMTSYVKRGYEIADRFREKGIPTIMGGVHPTFMPQGSADACGCCLRRRGRARL